METVNINSLITSFQGLSFQVPAQGSIINFSRYRAAGQISPSEYAHFEAKLLDRVRRLRETIAEGHPFKAVLIHAVLLLREMPLYSGPAFGRLREKRNDFEVSEDFFGALGVLSQDDPRVAWDSQDSWSEEGVQSGTFKARLSSGKDVQLTSFNFLFDQGEMRDAIFVLTSPESFSDIEQECDLLLDRIRKNHKDTQKLQDLIPTLFWWMAQGSFFEEGNAEIFEFVIAACIHESGLKPWNPEHDSYEAALVMGMEEFFNFCENFKK